MAYVPLTLPPSTPADFRALVTDQLEPHLRDVHTMLRLPLEGEDGMDGGCNFATVQVLLNVVSGISVSLLNPRKFSDRKSRRYLFVREMGRHFPWGAEPQDGTAMIGEPAAEFLYEHLRNPMTHTLGYHEEESRRAIKVAKSPLAEADIVGIETAGIRPNWQPTIASHPHKVIVSVEGLYWGVRQMAASAARVAARQALIVTPIITSAAVVSSTSTTVTTISSLNSDPDAGSKK